MSYIEKSVVNETRLCLKDKRECITDNGLKIFETLSIQATFDRISSNLWEACIDSSNKRKPMRQNNPSCMHKRPKLYAIVNIVRRKI